MMMMMNETWAKPRSGRWLGLAWAAGFLGFPIGGAATALVGPIDSMGTALVGGAVAGGVIGAAQWLVLRRLLPLSPSWVPATAGGMALGMMLGDMLLGGDISTLPLLLRGLIAGATIGAAQGVLLRGVVPAPTTWALVVTLAWALGWAVSAASGLDLTLKWAVFGATGALAFQFVTGLTLVYLLRQRRLQVISSFGANPVVVREAECPHV